MNSMDACDQIENLAGLLAETLEGDSARCAVNALIEDPGGDVCRAIHLFSVVFKARAECDRILAILRESGVACESLMVTDQEKRERGPHPSRYAPAAKKLGMTYQDYAAKLAAGLRWCWRCRAWHPSDHFARRFGSRHGLQGICLAHTREGHK